MTDIAAAAAVIKDCGYALIEHFTLPESAWWDSYYILLEERLRLLRQKHGGDPDRLALIESIRTEIEMFRRYSNYYGYVFFLMQRS